MNNSCTNRLISSIKTEEIQSPIVMVQTGQCSNSVGAENILSLIKASSKSANLIETGCDGLCFLAPKVIIEYPDRTTSVFNNVSAKDIKLITNKLNYNEPKTNSQNIATDLLNNQTRIAMDQCGYIDPVDAKSYISKGGYQGLAKALDMSRDEVVSEIQESKLLGRGGAYFPTGLKLQAVSKAKGKSKYVVINAEEGEPGVFKDRHLIEGVPHRIIEGAIISAYAVNSPQIIFYINAKAKLSLTRLKKAIKQSYQLNLLGKNILGSEYSIDASIVQGAGGYVCGEETTLLNTMEGDRREPRIKPPFPTESGYKYSPTLVNNCETLSNIPFILNNGADSFKKTGVENAYGTKIISLSGSVNRPGVFEIQMGTSIDEIIQKFGGGSEGEKSQFAVSIGGPSSGVLPYSQLHTKIAPGRIHQTGIMLGAGGVVVLKSKNNVLEFIRILAKYNANESCGKCTPCREGTPRIVNMLDKLKPSTNTSQYREELSNLAEVVSSASLCGLGQGAGTPIKSFLHFWPD